MLIADAGVVYKSREPIETVSDVKQYYDALVPSTELHGQRDNSANLECKPKNGTRHSKKRLEKR